MTRPESELRSPGPLANTLTARPMSGFNNYMVSSNYFYLVKVICLHIVIWFKVTNNNNLK